MRPQLALICPRCRVFTQSSVQLWQISKSPTSLTCTNANCSASYPSTPLAVLLPEPGRIFEYAPRLPDFGDDQAHLNVLNSLPEQGRLFKALSKRSSYLWSHFHDLLPSECRPGFVHERPFALRALDLLDSHPLPPHSNTLVAGCGPGRAAVELAARLADERRHDDFMVYSLDLEWGHLLDQRHLLDGEALSFSLRESFSRWRSALSIQLPQTLLAAAQHVSPLCANALDAPFAPNSFELIVALNLLDAVTDPVALLHQCNLLLKPGGMLLLATPFAWHPEITAPEHRLIEALCGSHPAVDSRDELACLDAVLSGNLPIGYGRPFEFEQLTREQLTWHLRIHSTSFQTFLSTATLWKKRL